MYYILSIESKLNGKDLEENIGQNLKTYLEDLFTSYPCAVSKTHADWRIYSGDKINFSDLEILSIGAFIYSREEDAKVLMNKSKLDAIFAIEFGSETTLHLISKPQIKEVLTNSIKECSESIDGLIVQIH